MKQFIRKWLELDNFHDNICTKLKDLESNIKNLNECDKEIHELLEKRAREHFILEDRVNLIEEQLKEKSPKKSKTESIGSRIAAIGDEVNETTTKSNKESA